MKFKVGDKVQLGHHVRHNFAAKYLAMGWHPDDILIIEDIQNTTPDLLVYFKDRTFCSFLSELISAEPELFHNQLINL